MSTKTTPMMKCGHAANAKNKAGLPACVICIGIDPGAEEIDDSVDLTGRKARCSYYGHKCHSEADSKPGALAFFEHRPGAEFDTYYCGCYGWD